MSYAEGWKTLSLAISIREGKEVCIFTVTILSFQFLWYIPAWLCNFPPQHDHPVPAMCTALEFGLSCVYFLHSLSLFHQYVWFHLIQLHSWVLFLLHVKSTVEYKVCYYILIVQDYNGISLLTFLYRYFQFVKTLLL